MKTIPVSNSVTFTLYSRITPFDKEGEDHDSDIDREVTLVPVTFCGALGAETKKGMRGYVSSEVGTDFHSGNFGHLLHWSVPL